jgi:lysozyme
MQLSKNGLLRTQHSEGFSPTVYPDANGFSIGYGTHLDTPTLLKTFKNATITPELATELMRGKINDAEFILNSPYVSVPLNQNQFDALMDFIYNEGGTHFKTSTLLKLLNQGNYQGAANEFNKWIYVAGKILPGLITRRNEEKELFLTA